LAAKDLSDPGITVERAIWAEPPRGRAADAYLRPVAGGTLTSLGLAELSGLELLQRQLAGTAMRRSTC